MVAGTTLGNVLTMRSDELAEALVERYYVENPEIEERYGAAGRKKCLRDAQYHIAYLAEAALVQRPVMWHRYVEWARAMLVSRHIPIHDLDHNLDCLRRVLADNLSAPDSALALRIMNGAAARETDAVEVTPIYDIEPVQPLAQLAAAYLVELLTGDRRSASRMILEAVDGGVSVRDIYIHVFQRCQIEIGRRWQLNLVSVAQEHYCSAATQLIMSQLYTGICGSQRVGRTMVAASVGGDLHEIGVRMISDFFEMEGWDTFYLGASTPAESLLTTVRERKPDVVAISVTMPYHVSEAARLIVMLRSADLVHTPKILIGGLAFTGTGNLWQEIGADAIASDASLVVGIATKLLGIAA